MQRWRWAFFLGFLLAAGLAWGAEYGVVEAPSGLILRIWPARGHPKVTTLPHRTKALVILVSGQEETIDGLTGRWMLIEHQGRRGWGFGGFVRLTGEKVAHPDIDWKTWRNDRFGYSIAYPPALLSPTGDTPDGGGQTFRSGDGSVSLTVSAQPIPSGKTQTDLFFEAMDSCPGGKKGPIGDDFFCFTGSDERTGHYRKVALIEGMRYSFDFTCPKDRYYQYLPLAERMHLSFPNLPPKTPRPASDTLWTYAGQDGSVPPVSTDADLPTTFVLGPRTFHLWNMGALVIREEGRPDVQLQLPLPDDFCIDGFRVQLLGENLLFSLNLSTGTDGATRVILVDPSRPAVVWTAFLETFNFRTLRAAAGFLYVGGLGTVAKLRLSDGTFAWKHEDLYDRGSGSFNSFDEARQEGDHVVFICAPQPTKGGNPAVIRVDDATGRIVAKTPFRGQ
ncbi:MAG: hypothetical protein GX442_14230 [Candidatus Riflebacteria bacterium]|nr:hypothetical protein [Candidatus Riflebacteria bacterium]